MAVLLAVALGGAAGSLARYGMVLLLDNHSFPYSFPWGIFLSNIIGSFLIGVALVLIVEKALVPDIWRPLVMTGFLGGFTTFSTFSLQALWLLQSGRLLAAGAYMLGSLLLGVVGAFLGILLTRILLR